MTATHEDSSTLTDHAAQVAAVSDASAPMVFDEADRIVIGTPCYGGNVKMGFMTSYNELLLHVSICLLYTSPSPRDRQKSRMPSSA